MSPKKDKKTDKKLAKKAAGPGTSSDNELTEAEINDLQENIQVSDWGEGAPPRKAKARPDNKPFVYVDPTPGTVLLWESWLRHEVPVNRAASERISVSFNYAWT